MEKTSFDDIVRNLLVFLKGQIPSLQGKTSREELARQIQSIVYMLRTSIIQLEGAAYSDPRNTPEFKALTQELDGVKRTNQRLEESLFLEMNKSQRLTTDLDKTSTGQDGQAVRQAQDVARIAELEGQIEVLKAQVRPPPPGFPLEERARLLAQIEALKSQAQPGPSHLSLEERARLDEQIESLKAQVRVAPPAGFSREEKQKLESDLEGSFAQNSALKRDLGARETELAELKDLLRSAAQAGLAEKENSRVLGLQLEQAKTQITNLQFQIGQAINKPLPSRPDDLETIRLLKEDVSRLQASLNSRPTVDVFKHLQAASQAKITFMEQSIAEMQKKVKDRSSQLEQAPEQIDLLKREKMQLEQRIIDMEATVRRLTVSREKSLKGTSPRTPVLRSEEYVFFFEVLSAIANRLAKSPENKDIRQKAEEAIAILESSRAIEGIPTVGFSFDEKLHKVVRAFQTTLVEDSTIVFEAGRGFKTSEHVIQRAIVWIAKSKFKCSECGTVSRPQDHFCPKCGMELCAPDGTTKKKLQPLPATIDLGLPLIDFCMGQRRIQEANDLLIYLTKEHPDHPGLQKRRSILAQIADQPNPP